MIYIYHHVNRRLVLETCCERKINVKSFVKLQFCLEEVRENERTHLDHIYHNGCSWTYLAGWVGHGFGTLSWLYLDNFLGHCFENIIWYTFKNTLKFRVFFLRFHFTFLTLFGTFFDTFVEDFFYIFKFNFLSKR